LINKCSSKIKSSTSVRQNVINWHCNFSAVGSAKKTWWLRSSQKFRWNKTKNAMGSFSLPPFPFLWLSIWNNSSKTFYKVIWKIVAINNKFINIAYLYFELNFVFKSKHNFDHFYQCPHSAVLKQRVPTLLRVTKFKKRSPVLAIEIFSFIWSNNPKI